MPSPFMLADPPHAFGVDPAKRDRIESLSPQSLHHLVVEPVVLAIKAALELRSRPALQVEPARRFAKHLCHETGPLIDRLRAQAHPEEVLDDVGLDQRS